MIQIKLVNKDIVTVIISLYVKELQENLSMLSSDMEDIKMDQNQTFENENYVWDEK